MIEPTAVVYENSFVHDSAYVGHFAIVGHPLRIDSNGRGSERSPWEAPRGARIMANAVVSSNCHIDDLATIEEEVWIGRGCRVGHGTTVMRGAKLYYNCQVYDRVVIGPGAVVAGFVCNDSVIGADAQVYGSLVHRLVDAPRAGSAPIPSEVEPAPRIGPSAVVGAGAIVVGGLMLGEGAYLAAGAVLTRDADPHTLYVGVPARAAGPAPSPVRPR